MPKIFLGEREYTGKTNLVFDELRRHCLTVASSGSGKGAGLILNNCVFWDGSLVVVDPKGEAAEYMVKLRDDADIAVLDPFSYAETPHHRVRFNPLKLVQDSDDIRMLTSGIVMRTGNENDSFWIDSAEEIIAGLIAFLMECADEDEKNLPELQELINSINDVEERADLVKAMRSCTGYAKLAANAASRLSQDGGTVRSIMQHVQTATSWMFSEAMTEFLKGGDDLDLNQLKRGKLKLFLVLPPKRLEQYGSFLRLFVRSSLAVMWEKVGTEQKGTPCLFLLDEFAALGKINEIRSAALQQGRSYGLHVWPFVISFGQLENLYGQDGAQDFLASADYFTAFGIQDDRTAELISKRIGYVTSDDVAPELDQIHRTIEQEEAYRAGNAEMTNHLANQAAEHDENNRLLQEELRYQRAMDDHKFWAGWSSWLAGPPPQKRQIVRPRTTNVTPQRPQALYAQADAVRARIGKLRISPEEIRLRTRPVPIYGTMISSNMYLETPSGWGWMYLLPHFVGFTEGSVGAYHAKKAKSYRLADLSDSHRVRAAQQALEALENRWQEAVPAPSVAQKG